ncbi:MAG: hypothetical protein WD696_17150, partial [Bryobacteraceae bacterium]
MNRRVFYSWQSDTEPRINRNFVEDALKRALRSIKKNAGIVLDPVLDRDTAGLPGSPAISEAIFVRIPRDGDQRSELMSITI